MENHAFEKDTLTVYVAAESFPEGVLKAHQTLHAAVGRSDDRRYFGISWPDGNGGIHYLAAAEMLEGTEPESLGLKIFTIRKGPYIGITLRNYMQDIPPIGRAFETLLGDPRIAHDGYCLEWYLTDEEMICLVPIEHE